MKRMIVAGLFCGFAAWATPHAAVAETLTVAVWDLPRGGSTFNPLYSPPLGNAVRAELDYPDNDVVFLELGERTPDGLAQADFAYLWTYKIGGGTTIIALSPEEYQRLIAAAPSPRWQGIIALAQGALKNNLNNLLLLARGKLPAKAG
jgi:hypothetical protein